MMVWHTRIASDKLSLAATYVTFDPGSVARQAGGSDGSFFTASIQLMF